MLVPALFAAAYAAADLIDDGNSLLATLRPGVRQALFVSAAATTGALLGFAITGVTILLTVGEGPRMSWLKSKAVFRRDVRFIFFSAIIGMALSTLAFLVLIAVATDDGFACAWGVVAAAAAALTVDRLWRLISFLSALMGVALRDADDPAIRNAPFKEPMEAE